ncbi:MAG: mannosyltransferase family protein [Myxococcota bacterium]|nr:mannosyltransferase family protein [Myxococcota bacterium]
MLRVISQTQTLGLENPPSSIAAWGRWGALILAISGAIHLLWFSGAEIGHFFPRFEPHGSSWSQRVHMWTRWDGGHYLRIAREGYNNGEPNNQSVAFFPLYPMLMAGVSDLLDVEDYQSGLLISHFFHLVTLWLVFWLARIRFHWELKPILLSLGAFALYPAHNFGFSIYTESLFLSLSLGAFIAYEYKYFLLAGILAALASGTRSQGVLVGAALWLDFAWQHRSTLPTDLKSITKLLRLSIFPLGLFLYSTYLHFEFGDFLIFSKTQALWGRHLTTPIHTILQDGANVDVYLILVGSVYLTYTMWQTPHHHPLRDRLYTTLSLALPLCSGSMQSFSRLVWVLFPLYIVGVMKFQTHSKIKKSYVVLGLFFSLIYAFKVGQKAGVT